MIWVGIVVLVIIAGGAWYLGTQKTEQTSMAQTNQNFGTYNYECDEHVMFSATMASDMSSVAIKATGTGTYPPASTLSKKTASSGVRYEGNGVVFTAKGETVTLGEGDSAINCSPVSTPGEAPFNFGD